MQRLAAESRGKGAFLLCREMLRNPGGSGRASLPCAAPLIPSKTCTGTMMGARAATVATTLKHPEPGVRCMQGLDAGDTPSPTPAHPEAHRHGGASQPSPRREKNQIGRASPALTDHRSAAAAVIGQLGAQANVSVAALPRPQKSQRKGRARFIHGLVGAPEGYKEGTPSRRQGEEGIGAFAGTSRRRQTTCRCASARST